MHFAARNRNSIQTTLGLSLFFFLVSSKRNRFFFSFSRNFVGWLGKRSALAATRTRTLLLSCLRTAGKVPGTLLSFSFWKAKRPKGSQGGQSHGFCAFRMRPPCSMCHSHAVGNKHNGAYSLPSSSSTKSFAFSFLFFLPFFSFSFLSMVGMCKRFACGTAGMRELPASPDLLRQVRLELWLRNRFPGLYITPITCNPTARCRAVDDAVPNCLEGRASNQRTSQVSVDVNTDMHPPTRAMTATRPQWVQHFDSLPLVPEMKTFPLIRSFRLSATCLAMSGVRRPGTQFGTQAPWPGAASSWLAR